MIRVLITGILILVLVAATPFSMTWAQGNYYPRDTTYTIHSVAQKIQQDYPAAKPVFFRMPTSVMVHPNLVYLTLDSGRQLHLDVFKTNTRRNKKRPVILMIHGGGWMLGAKENLHPMAGQLAKTGYVAVTVEYRLGTEAGYPAAICDLKTALRWLRKHADEFALDSNKVAVYGCSAGAQLATLLGVTMRSTQYDQHQQYLEHSADVHAVLNIDGIVSFTHPEAEPEWTGKSANAWLGDYENHYEKWEMASPLEHTDAYTPPTMFVNSSRSRFHAGRDDYLAVLAQYGIDYDVYSFEDAPHGFWLLKPWFRLTLKKNIQFLKKTF